MMIKGMQNWTDYISDQLDLICEPTPWGSRYTIPPHRGHGFMEAIEAPGQWVIWKSDFVMKRKFSTTYTQEDPYYMSFSYWEGNYTEKDSGFFLPGDEIIDFESRPGFCLKGLGVFFYMSFFEQLVQRDSIDLVLSIQSYDDKALMKQIKPVLRQMFDYDGSGPAMRLFMESRLLEIASILVTVVEKETGNEKINLSAFDCGQLHEVLKILERTMAAPPGISELARMTALNEYKLKAGFRQLFGTTVYEYLRLLRMEKAAELLEKQKLSPVMAGQQVGYKTLHGFNNAFKKYYGKTPQEWQDEKNAKITLP